MAATLLARLIASVSVSEPRGVLRCTAIPSLEKCFSKYFSSDSSPKRPQSSYLTFLNTQRDFYKKKYPDLNHHQLMKEIARIWRELPQHEKEHYEAIVKPEWDKYKEQMAKYRSQLNPVEDAALKEEKRIKKEIRKQARIKRVVFTIFISKYLRTLLLSCPFVTVGIDSIGKPKKSRSSFNIFVSEHFQETEAASSKERFKALCEEWKNMASPQKQVYSQLAEDDKIRYANEMRSWEQQMKASGRGDVLNYKFTMIRKTKET
ncbi:transcription factor A, mitochondrial [Thamnophis elegans]|uniref:transcription factor A, mitochondrial n=1 Tax=Thamnophis elegans TaxID=35005 RepID=UPI001377A69A|nr:transcription factor A, mitochondrial [Thamnophis elegans]